MRKRVNALLFSVVAHVVLILLASLFFDEVRNEVDAIMVEWVKLPRVARKKRIKAIKPATPEVRELKQSNIAVARSPVRIQAVPGSKGVLGEVRTPSLVTNRSVAEIETNARIPRRPDEEALARRSGGELGTGRGLEGTSIGASDELRKGRGGGDGTVADVGITGGGDSATLEGVDFGHRESVPDGELGAVLTGEGKDISGHIRIIRLKHSLSDWWQDPTAIPSFAKWLAENTRLRADMDFKGNLLHLSDRDDPTAICDVDIIGDTLTLDCTGEVVVLEREK